MQQDSRNELKKDDDFSVLVVKACVELRQKRVQEWDGHSNAIAVLWCNLSIAPALP